MQLTKCLGYQYSEPNQLAVELRCDITSEVISVNRAFLALATVPLVRDNAWCRNPYHSAKDCTQFEGTLTNEFRENCNAVSFCTRPFSYTSLEGHCNTQIPDDSYNEHYIHVEYECISSKLFFL